MAKQEQKLEKPLWVKLSLEEVEAIAIKLAGEGHTSEKIGLILRDQYGIPSTRIFGKKLGKILKEKNVYKDANLANVEQKHLRIKTHLQKHHTDRKSKRALEIRTARVRKMKKYIARKNTSAQ